MKKVKYELSLKGLPTPSGSISFATLRAALDVLTLGSERSLRLAVEGASVRRGKSPAWLSKSTDFVLTRIGKGSTTIEFTAPTLGEVAPKQIEQQDLWYTVPDPTDTAITVFSRSVTDSLNERLESECFDAGVLDSIITFKSLLEDDKVRISLTSERRKESFKLDDKSFKTIKRMRKATPEPQATVVTGLFNMIEHSTRKFQLALADGRVLRGRIDEGLLSVEHMRDYWGKQVTLKGSLSFLASGEPRILLAEMIRPHQRGDDVFERVTVSQSVPQIISKARSDNNNRNVVTEIWGKWPGEESIEELLTLLDEPFTVN